METAGEQMDDLEEFIRRMNVANFYAKVSTAADGNCGQWSGLDLLSGS